MKIAVLITRNLLGLIFLVFGLNGFLHFIPMPPPTGLALQYMTVLSASHYFEPIFLLQAVGGALLLANRFVPIALVLLGPIIVNILLFHILMAPQGLPLALVTTALWLTVFYGVRQAFAGVFAARVQTPEGTEPS
jgi:putative oxidoreductase